MNELFKQFKNVHITAEEKQTGFNRLQSFITNNPVQSAWYVRAGNKIVSPFQGNMMHSRLLASAFVMIILVSATGGTSIAARYSIPGDILYPVKINVNEKVEAFTALSVEAKAEVEAKHVDQRLVEAEQLTEQNKFNNDLKTQIETQFSQDIQNTMTHVQTLNVTGDTKNAKKIKINVENSLQKHKKIVEEILKEQSSKNAERKSVETVAPKMMMVAPEVPPDTNDTQVSTFSATMSVSATTTSDTVANQAKIVIIQSDTESEEERTPLLDETLDRIFNSRLDVDR